MDSAYNSEALCDDMHNPEVVKGCTVEVNSAIVFKPAFTCARHCTRDKLCIGYSFRPGQTGCFLHFHCGNPDTCKDITNIDSIVFYRRKATQSECVPSRGSWQTSESRCQCTKGHVGRRCERYPESCSELALWRYDFDVIMKMYIKPHGFQKEFLVVCRLFVEDKKANTLFLKNMLRKGPYSPVTCNWEECVTGVATEGKSINLWTGLQYLPHLAAASSTKTMTLCLEINGADNVQMVYEDIQIGDESTDYALTYSSYTGNGNGEFPTLKNCMPLPQKPTGASIPFSTPDHDRDLEDNRNCAELAGRGWWFSECNSYPMCNPMGDLRDPSDGQALWFSGMNIVTSSIAPSLAGMTAYFVDDYDGKLPGF